MVNPDHTTASARARRGQDAAEHRRRGRARGRGVGDVVDEVDTADVQHEDVPGDVGQQTQGGAPPPTAYPGGPDELSLLISYDQHEVAYVRNNKVSF